MGDKKTLETWYSVAFLDATDRNGSLTEWIIIMVADTSNREDYFKKADSARKRNRVYKTYTAPVTFHFASV